MFHSLMAEASAAFHVSCASGVAGSADWRSVGGRELKAVRAFCSLIRALRKESKVFCCCRTAMPFSASLWAAFVMLAEMALPS